MTFEYEWEDMTKVEGEKDEDRRARGPFYGTLKRVERNKDFFERTWKLQPRVMAVFGPETEKIFLKLHQSRRFIEVSAQMLSGRRYGSSGDWDENRQRQRDQWEADVWIGMDAVNPGIDRVGRGLTEFKEGMENLCRPITEREYRPK